MGFFDMFDKLDDIIYKPVETFCEWCKEPLRVWERKRDRGDKELETQLAIAKNEADMKLTVEQRKLNTQIDLMVAEAQQNQLNKLVDSIKDYQLTLSSALQEMTNQLGHLSIELRKATYGMVEEQVSHYQKIIRCAKEERLIQIKEITDNYGEGSKIFDRLFDEILLDQRTTIDLANDFIRALKEDQTCLLSILNHIIESGQASIEQLLDPQYVKKLYVPKTNNLLTDK